MTPFARRLAGLVALVLVGCLVWWSQAGEPSGDASAGPASPTSSSTTNALPDMPILDVVTIAISELPTEAVDTLGLIEAGGPFPFAKDGSVFGNREKFLPLEKSGYYREYTVPTPGSADRGARRIVVGGGGEAYYSPDHYQSFRRIRATQ